MSSHMEIVFPGGKRVDALYRGFVIKTDQKKVHGGEESAPQPFDLFLASMGTCAGIYVLEFCQARNIPTDGAKILLSVERDSKKKMLSKIALNIVLPPEFPEKYRRAVVNAAELCAVVKHLQDPPVVEVRTTTAE
ncbi:MAG TPA: osmotically inducible protein C [Firmicutes bacterium]|nr:osmotically inducible protein C [Bacillota bacterium]